MERVLLVCLLTATVMTTSLPEPYQECKTFEECKSGKETFLLNLVKHLLEQYKQHNPSKAERPVVEYADVINVEYGLGLINLIDYDESTHIMKVVAWDKFKWYDVLLQWDPENWGGITEIRLPADAIWHPDITLYNGVSKDLDLNGARVVVYSTGQVIYIPSIEKQVKCVEESRGVGQCNNITCTFKVGSWVYSSNQLDIEFYGGSEEVSTEDYIPDFRYSLVGSNAVREAKVYPCCPETYPSITFNATFNKINC